MDHWCTVIVMSLWAAPLIVDAGGLPPMFLPLGQGYYLPELDILATLAGGQSLYQNMSVEECLTVVPFSGTDSGSQTYMFDSDTFYHQVSTNSGVSASLQGAYTMSATLDVKTDSVSSGFTEIQGSTLDIYTFVNMTVLQKDCYSSSFGKANLSDVLLRDYKSLQINVTNPAQPNSWEPYKNFLKKYGSHFVVNVRVGARLQQWTFAKHSENYVENDLKIKACADFEGVTEVGKLNVSGCVGYSSKDAERVEHMETSSHLDIKGGTDQTRAQLIAGDRSKELIIQFLTEGREHQTPVDYVFESIWEMLKIEFPSGDPYHAIALNLEQYYKGLLDFGCTPQTSANGLPLRWFGLSRNSHWETPEYQCEIERDGCHDNADCHKGGAGTVTYCYGPSCVQYGDPAPGTKAKDVTIRSDKAESYKVGINKSCYYHLVPSDARCHGSSWSNDQIIWIGDMGPVMDDPLDQENQNENPPKHDEI